MRKSSSNFKNGLVRQPVGFACQPEWPQLAESLRLSPHSPTPQFWTLPERLPAWPRLPVLFTPYFDAGTFSGNNGCGWTEKKKKKLAGAVKTKLGHEIPPFYHEVSKTFAPRKSFSQAETQRPLPLQ